ncbi:hypothetical protein ACSVH2_07010 [Flavobacterium sp. RSB2_4_14]|uniref:hypothetical protein n=1 Tax=Flavobacterium sp. RSB2_4_14 TaxID=3447665 RepID=UPI003F3C8D57
MKKIATLCILSIIIYSCKLTDQNDEDVQVTTNTVAKDSSVVNDKDENGCLASAGYVWSKVNKECVKGYSGIQLNPMDDANNEDETVSAYVLFNEDASKAEVFLPKDTTSIVLTRSAEGKPWVYQDWQLIAWKGYVLKKGGENKFSGDAEMGKKVLGSDTEQ